MEIIKVFAKDLDLGDVLGEGQEIWCKVTNTEIESGPVVVYWGGIQKPQTRVEFKPFELVTVLRGTRKTKIATIDGKKFKTEVAIIGFSIR